MVQFYLQSSNINREHSSTYYLDVTFAVAFFPLNTADLQIKIKQSM